MHAPFQLIGLQHHGQTLHWQWDGRSAPAETSLAQVLQTLDGLTPAARQQAHALQLQRQSSATAGAWWLYGAQGDWVCTLNGQPLPLGQAMRLNDGDVIEIGFVRMKVQCQSTALQSLPVDLASDRLASERATETLTSTIPATTPPTPPEISTFELVDLALSDGARPTREGVIQSDDDISDLVNDGAAVPDFEAQSATVSAALPDAHKAASGDPLQVLHEAYLRRLHSPLYSDPQAQWQRIERTERMQTQDPLQHLQKLAGDELGLSDLLGQSHRIEEAMASFDNLSAVDVLAPEPFDNLMHLFAPEDFQQAHSPSGTDSIATDEVLPGLTRREHHSLSLDSAMPIQKTQS